MSFTWLWIGQTADFSDPDNWCALDQSTGTAQCLGNRLSPTKEELTGSTEISSSFYFSSTEGYTTTITIDEQI